MNEKTGYILIGKEKLHYLQWGSGPRLLLAFHGYGNDARTFSPFREYLSEAYTILSFDLPYHGESKWKDNIKLTKKDLMVLVETLKITHDVTKVSLLGYSMGGRVCLAIVENMPEDIDKVALIAADGLTINLYYYFFTRTFIGKKLFKKMLEKPQLFFNAASWLRKKHLINASRYQFVMHSLQSEANRQFLLQVWPGMSDLIPSPTKLKRLIQQYRLPVYIFMGANDRIMPPSIAQNFKSDIDSIELFILQKGHRVFDHENARQIAGHLL